MIHDNDTSNFSNNRPFEDVLQVRLSRRGMLARTAALSATGFLAALGGEKVLSAGAALAQRSSLVNFRLLPVAQANGPMAMISEDYQYEVLIPWGTPIQPGGPTYDGDPVNRPTSAQQLQQIGLGHDGMHFFPVNNSNTHGILAINHEFGTNEHVLGIGKLLPTTLEETKRVQYAHGLSVVEIKKINGKWQIVASDKNRRIQIDTPVTFSGPVANHPLLKTAANNPTQGTFNNCANGYTPWGTYLTCEENFNGYFGATGTWTATTAQSRYGFSRTGFGYGWEKFDPRFDLSNASYANNENRFGWVVEIDPANPNVPPVKRTALGRVKHEGAELVEGQGGRAVVYMGDDERNDYIYKFVSESNWRSMRARGMSPLDRGKLYVAKFNDNGTGNWLELTINNPVLRAKFADQAEVLTYARLAGDALGATPMDRPEWITKAANGYMYCTLTNNSRRTTPNAANPLAPNPDGHIIRWRDSNNHVGLTFVWDIFILSKDTHAPGDERTFSSPDGLWADDFGRLFIETDGTQQKGLNDQMLVADLNTGEIRRLFSGPAGCEVTGITITPDQRTMFVNIQHPGDGNPATTNFPAAQGSGKIPRDATIVITRKNGGIIGS
jgi:uncharacterized protein